MLLNKKLVIDSDEYQKWQHRFVIIDIKSHSPYSDFFKDYKNRL